MCYGLVEGKSYSGPGSPGNAERSLEYAFARAYQNPGENIIDKLTGLIDNHLAFLPREDTSARGKVVLHFTGEQISVWGLSARDAGVSPTLPLTLTFPYLKSGDLHPTIRYLGQNASGSVELEVEWKPDI